jgi:hypothetical protein
VNEGMNMMGWRCSNLAEGAQSAMDNARKLHPLNCVAYFVSHSLKTVMEEAALQRQWHVNNKILVPFAWKHAADMAVLSLRCQVTGENGMLNKSLVFCIRFMHTYFCIR